MQNILEHVDIVFIVVGALFGSLKASAELDRDKAPFVRWVDILLGFFCGTTVAFHFNNPGAPYLSGLIAMVGGVSGATAVEVLLQMVPGIVNKVIGKVVDSKLK